MKFTTKTGGSWDTTFPAYSNIITTINERNPQTTRMQKLSLMAISGTHTEFGEAKTDLLVKDEFGETHEICEDFVWQ